MCQKCKYINYYLFTFENFFFNELSSCHQLKFCITYILATFVKTFYFQTLTFWYSRIHSLKYRRVAVLGCKDIGIEKLEFVTKKNQFLQGNVYSLHLIFWFTSQTLLIFVSGQMTKIFLCVLLWIYFHLI